jgi:pyruvate,orthophosphate dikinase
VNDHADPDYDAVIIGRLTETDSAIQPVCAALAAVLERFGGYGERFATALDRIRGGDLDWFTKPMIDSYHTVWFELHENLLATLGIQRAKEKEHAAG